MRIRALSFVPVYIQGIMSSDKSIQFVNIKKLRSRLCCEKSPPIQAVIDSGVVPRIIELAKDHKFPHVQFESVWSLLNIAAGPHEANVYLINNDAHLALIDLLQTSNSYEIKRNAMYIKYLSLFSVSLIFTNNICI